MITTAHLENALLLDDMAPQDMRLPMTPSPRGVAWPGSQDLPPRQASVLILAFPGADEGLNIVLTRRSDALRGHAGQISFPGGQRDPRDPDPIVTALRETCEELGLCDDHMNILGTLPDLYIPPTHYNVAPVVATMTATPQFRPNADEVAEVLTLPITQLLDPALKHSETRHLDGIQWHIPYYDVNGHKVWGATAMMLSELEGRLRCVLPGEVPVHPH